MRLRHASPVLLFVCALLVYAQDVPYKLNVNVPVMSLEAVVKDANGRPLTHVTLADFEIYEDGQKQEIRFFGAAETPRSVLLVFDVTGVMDSQGPFMAQGMNVFFANLREQDRVAMGVMGPEFEMFMPFRKLEKDKPVNIKMPKERMGSNLWDSLDMAARRFNKEEGRKAIIAMTDGRETAMFNETTKLGYVQPVAEDLPFKAHLNNAKKRAIPYYFIALNTDPRYMGQPDFEYAYFKNGDYIKSPQYGTGRRTPTLPEDYLTGVKVRMERLAEATGGRVVYPKSLEDVVTLYQQMAVELGLSYSLGYTPKAALDDGKFHRVEVRVKGAATVEQSRDGYGGPDVAAKKN